MTPDNMSQADRDQWLVLDRKYHMVAQSTVPFDPVWKGNQRRWQAHTSGNLYALTVRNRTMSHTFVVHQHGKNAWQAGLRYYKGSNAKGGNWVWQCTKVVSAKLLPSK